MSINEGEQSGYANPLVEGDASPPKGSKRWIGASAAVAVAAALAVGGMQLVGVMAGGGAQPEDVLPASAIAFAKLDLNPSAGQKLAVFRLASKFPTSKDKVTSEDTSIKESTFGSIFTGDTGWGLDYAKDVEPWLGDRIGVGVFPDMDADKEPEVGLAISVTDQSAATVALDKAIANAADTQEKVGYAFADGFVIVSDTTAHASALVQAGKSAPLALPAGSTYSEDVKSLGSEQIGVAWADIAASYKAIAQSQPTDDALMLFEGPNDPKNVSGRVVVGLHADPSFIELNGKGIEIKGADPLVKADAATGPGMISSFPADVFSGVTATGLGKALAPFYSSATEGVDVMGIAPMLRAIGIDSAKQIESLLGAETGLVVGGTIDEPQYAVRTRGGDPDAAYELARQALSAAEPDTEGITVHKVDGPDGILIGMGPELISAMTSHSGSTLGSTESFTQVMPGVDQANFAAYVNLGKLMPLLAKDNPKDADALKALNALGLTATGGAEPSVRLRLSVR